MPHWVLENANTALDTDRSSFGILSHVPAAAREKPFFDPLAKPSPQPTLDNRGSIEVLSLREGPMRRKAFHPANSHLPNDVLSAPSPDGGRGPTFATPKPSCGLPHFVTFLK